MSTGVRVTAEEAMVVADEVVAALRPACSRIEVAGSLRRRKPDVGDVEVVAESLSHAEPSGLFFEADATVWDIDAAVDALTTRPTYKRLLGKDRYVKIRHIPSGLQVDLFIVRPPAQWGVILTIRTGPADYSQHLVMLARRRGLHVREGAVHRGGLGCGAMPCEVVPVDAEADFYAALGVPYREPWDRR